MTKKECIEKLETLYANFEMEMENILNQLKKADHEE